MQIAVSFIKEAEIHKQIKTVLPYLNHFSLENLGLVLVFADKRFSSVDAMLRFSSILLFKCSNHRPIIIGL